MSRMIFILSVSLGSVVLGYLLRRGILDRIIRSSGKGHEKGREKGQEKLAIFSKDLKLISMFVLNPIPIISSFWTFSLASTSYLFFPVLGIIVTLIGGISALVINALFRIPPKQAASVFTSGMFSNVLTFGGLAAFVFFGTGGYVLIQLYNMFVSTLYYLVGFPISEQVSRGRRFRFVLTAAVFRERPYLLIPITSIGIGLLLNWLGLPRPRLISSLTSLLIPFNTGLLGFSIGITLYMGRIGVYRREIVLISFIKFFVSPLFMVGLCLLLGLPHLDGGVPFKILVLASAMPVAFNSLIPPALYGFDLDLANSAWIVTTFSYILILPLFYVVLGI